MLRWGIDLRDHPGAAGVESLAKAAELNPSSAAAQAAVGEVLFFLKKPEKAVAALDKAIELDPEGPAADFAKALKQAHQVGVFG